MFPVFVSITQFSDFWVMSYGNWKHILGVFCFQNSIFNGIFVIKHTLRDWQQLQLLPLFFHWVRWVWVVFFFLFSVFLSHWSFFFLFSFPFHAGSSLVFFNLFFFFSFSFVVGVCLSFGVKSVWVSVLNLWEFWCWVGWVRCWLGLLSVLNRSEFGVELVWISVLNRWAACWFRCGFFLGFVIGGG